MLSVTPYYNSPNRRGIVAPLRGGRARGERRAGRSLYNIPGRTALNMAPDLLAELAQIDGIAAVKQANDDELQPIDGLGVLAGNDDGSLRLPRHRRRRRHLRRLAHRRRRDAADVRRARRAARRSTPRCTTSTTRCSSPPARRRSRRRSTCSATTSAALRLPMVEADEAELSEVRAVLERHGLLATAAAA